MVTGRFLANVGASASRARWRRPHIGKSTSYKAVNWFMMVGDVSDDALHLSFALAAKCITPAIGMSRTFHLSQ